MQLRQTASCLVCGVCLRKQLMRLMEEDAATGEGWASATHFRNYDIVEALGGRVHPCGFPGHPVGPPVSSFMPPCSQTRRFPMAGVRVDTGAVAGSHVDATGDQGHPSACIGVRRTWEPEHTTLL